MNRGNGFKNPSAQQSIFYALIFLIGFIYQPNWVYENFWSKAEFYDSLSFEFPFAGFALIYAAVLTYSTSLFVNFAKRFL